jgi:hypothetical protein
VKKQAFSFGCILYVRAVAEMVVERSATRHGHIDWSFMFDDEEEDGPESWEIYR